MPHDVCPPLLRLLLFLSLFGASCACLEDPASAYRFTGAVCRFTYPAAVVFNEKTTKVIEAAFQHARYPSVKGEKSLLFIGRVIYGLDNLEIHNLSIGRSEFELRPGEGIGMEISNVSAVFRGTIQYGYGSWLHTAGWFPFRRRVQVQEPNHLHPPEFQHNQQNENRNPNPNPADELADREREEPAAAVDESDGQGPMTAVLVPPHRVSVMWTAWVFFKTFFSSLIPEVPQGVAN